MNTTKTGTARSALRPSGFSLYCWSMERFTEQLRSFSFTFVLEKALLSSLWKVLLVYRPQEVSLNPNSRSLICNPLHPCKTVHDWAYSHTLNTLSSTLYGVYEYDWNVFWNHTWWSAQWRALCTKISEVSLSAVTDSFHEDFLITRWNKHSTEQCSFQRLRRNRHETVCK